MVNYINIPMRFLLVTLICFAGILIVPSCSTIGYSGETETLILAAVPTELNALVYVAEDQKFFVRNGLQLILKDYDSGATAAAGMLNGEADIALAAEFPVVRQVFNNKDIVNFGTIAKYKNTYIIWRSDSGIKTVQELKGKKIGVTLQTISEFYLGRTLELNNVNIQQVILIDTKAADSEKAIVNGDVDAVVTWEPWVNQISQRVGKEVIIQAAQSSEYAYWNLVSTTGWIKNHSNTIEKLLKSLAQAEDYIDSHQNEAKAIVQTRMNYDVTFMDTIWSRYQYSLSLDQSLILAMEDEARWMISNNLVIEKVVPNYLNFIYTDGLESVKPEAVRIAGK